MSFLFPTQEFRFFSWIPQSKDAGKLNFQLPAQNDKEPNDSISHSFNHSIIRLCVVPSKEGKRRFCRQPAQAK